MNILKTAVKKILSPDAINLFRNSIHIPARRRTRRIFYASDINPDYLPEEHLEELQKKYPKLPEYGYDEKSLERRGFERAEEILKLPGAEESSTFLELGCWDGMVSYMLSRMGKTAIAVDKTSEGFEEKVLSSEVRLLRMDAENLEFQDESLDFVFSYDAFEHFPNPEKVLREAIRVTKKGGSIFLSFGPLYLSPFGAHAYRSVTVPYCQVMFTKDTIDNFTARNGLTPVDYGQLNFRTLDDYRRLWKEHESTIKKVFYRERETLGHMDLIRKYPSCFRSKSENFENFTVSYIEVLFKKQG